MESEYFDYVTHCHTCGGITALCVDDPKWKRETAKFVSEKIRQGFFPKRMPMAEVKAQPLCRCHREKASKQLTLESA